MTDSDNVYSVDAPARTPIHPVDCSEGISIDFDVVAKKEDVDLLRAAVLELTELFESMDKTDFVNICFGPACNQLMEERDAHDE